MDVCACDIDVSLTDTHVIVSYRLSDSTDMHVSLIDTHVGTTLLTWMLNGTDKDVGLALGAAFLIRNACEMAARQREAARARQKERAAGGGGAPRARCLAPRRGPLIEPLDRGDAGHLLGGEG